MTLIDYAFSGKDKCIDFEVYTIDLLVNELAFNGVHLGGTRKPDGIFYHNNNGVIIDNKAYSKGFTISRGMADEMTRYVQETMTGILSVTPISGGSTLVIKLTISISCLFRHSSREI